MNVKLCHGVDYWVAYTLSTFLAMTFSFVVGSLITIYIVREYVRQAVAAPPAAQKSNPR